MLEFEERYQLRPYQEEAATATIEALEKGEAPLLVMATGSGKTLVFAEVIRRFIGSDRRALVLAHRNELIDQAINNLWRQTGIFPGKEKADKRGGQSRIIVGSVQTLQRERLKGWPKNYFALINVDEAHHAVARTYQNILTHFDSSIMGCTATPDRADAKQLSSVYSVVAYEYNLIRAIKEKYLAPIRGKRIADFEIDLRELRIVAGDFIDSELGNVVEQHIGPIASTIIDETRGQSTLVFCPNISSSAVVGQALRELGAKANFLSGQHNDKERRDILYRFSTGEITHLCSCNLLLEGFDEPRVSAIAMLRPTASRSLYAQAVGRGTRLYPGKEFLTLVEFTFNSDKLKLVEPYELFSTQGYGEDVRREAHFLADGKDSVDYLSILEEARDRAERVSSIFKGIQRNNIGKYELVNFDPFAMARLIGTDISGEFDISYQGHKLTGRITTKQKALLSNYGITNLESIDKAQASGIISKLFTDGYQSGRGPATANQLSFLKTQGYNFSGLTKASASIIIGRLTKELQEKVIF